MTDQADLRVRAQYDSYPYPPRDPRDEAKRLVVGSPSHLREIDHWIWRGRRPASRPLRALVAGGGTGDGFVMLASQLQAAGRPGEVIHLDRSAAAQGIARVRAEARGLDNVGYVEASLLDLPSLGLGAFDYIDCCGVLHHLPDPEEGLRTLKAALAPGGGIGLMVYGTYGRTGVYHVQEALRALAPASLPDPERVGITRRLLGQLPASNWLKRNPLIDDHRQGDAALFDLLLHAVDRAYRVPELAALVHAAGLDIAAWLEPLRYDPDPWLPDPRLRERTATLDPVARAAVAEAVTGNLTRHLVYLVRAEDPAPPVPDPLDPDLVPCLREWTVERIQQGLRPDHTLPIDFEGLILPRALPPLAIAMLRLVDGSHTVASIAAEVTARGVPASAFDRQWPLLWHALEPANRLLSSAPK